MSNRFLLKRLRAVAAFLFVSVLWSTVTVAQQRDPAQTIGHTVFDEPEGAYRFERFTVENTDSQTRYRVTLGIPAASAPASNYPAFWMLDGNAALMEFDAALLDALGERPAPPVLVFVGYDNDLRIDRRRVHDYTFIEDGDQGGGANALLEVIEERIRPIIAQYATTDPQQQTLWGHSLGGLFTLTTLFTRPDAFDTYAAGSPSLWWAEGALLDGPEQAFIANHEDASARVLLSLGGDERRRDTSHRDLNDPRVREHLRRVTSVPADTVETLAERLDALAGVTATYREFNGMNHGQTFRASLMDALAEVTGVNDVDAVRASAREPSR
ncbi:alpha/beta hydrolase-fold protein [Halomonas sp. PAMB 3232]|uniref:alpha/beta hydrolase n=1 Tax=Halomonas sp. PAMB 3232 TaxID=3075221 RepID=UPI00289F6F59|nr:alpha/beta hydrolase-fold protein [Halomonas sp. PAMB 3232]WNL39941.1 alpha/beta hydrolase-fold protein [Halomonas sp. PAMB 3232]